MKTNKCYARFLDAYGRDKADEPILKIVAASEVFGQSKDEVVRDDVTGRSANGGIDHKLARKIKQKKISQGHAADNHEMQEQVL